MNDKYLIYTAYYYWVKEEILPVDIYIQLNNANLSPECLITQFERGILPVDCDVCGYCFDDQCEVNIDDIDDEPLYI